MSELIGKSIGRYHILEQLGQGGMATVYKAYDTRLEADVAVKVIRTDMFPPAVLERVLQRFEREAKALARLTHPNIVGVIDYGEQDGMPYLVMKYLPGGTLKELTGNPMHYLEAVQILEPIARALAYAHKQGILHRDVKPSNILITESQEPVLTDFGIAKLLESEETQTLTGTGLGIGTPEYMAPEQGLGKEVDGRADIYALGVVLYELITGHKPYSADTPMAVIVKQIHDPLPGPRKFIPDLPDEVEKVLFKALAKDPENRYQSMDEFCKSLNILIAQFMKVSNKQKQVKLVYGNNEIYQTGDEVTHDEICAPIDKSSQVVLDDKREKISEKIEYKNNELNPKKKIPTRSWLGVGGIVVILLILLLIRKGEGQSQVSFLVTETQTPTQTSTATMTQTSLPTSTITHSPIPRIIKTQLSKIDGMVQVYVPEGEFDMGWNEGYANEQPVHPVYMDAYWIAQTEVTNSMYAMCIDDGGCFVPSVISSNTRNIYYGNSQYDAYPIVYINWYEAQAYCEWAGRKLPTEAQWEKAARGTDGRIFPWGEGSSCQEANYRGCEGDTIEVGILDNGKSPYGASDMAGNVWEWVSDWYDEDYYGTITARNNNTENIDESTYKVLRGGSWSSLLGYLRVSYRYRLNPDERNNNIGFRCVTSE